MTGPGQLDPDALAYESVADRYEAGRPSYQAHLSDRVNQLIGEVAADVIVDLAAGTGKFTRSLDPPSGLLVAVEPVAAMGRELVAAVDGVRAVRGLAGAIPLVDSSVGAMTVAQAFQWFHERDIFEMARVLRPGGLLALVWNNRQDTGDWEIVSRVLRPYRSRQARSVDAVGRLEASGRFSTVHVERWDWTRTLTRVQLHDHLASLSWIAALDSRDSERVHRQVDEAFGSRQTHHLDYVSELVWARRHDH